MIIGNVPVLGRYSNPLPMDRYAASTSYRVASETVYRGQLPFEVTASIFRLDDGLNVAIGVEQLPMSNCSLQSASGDTRLCSFFFGTKLPMHVPS